MIAPESIADILGLGTSVPTVEELETAVSAGLPKRSCHKCGHDDVYAQGVTELKRKAHHRIVRMVIGGKSEEEEEIR